MTDEERNKKIEDIVKDLIDEIQKSDQDKIEREDIREIAKELLPDIHKIISNEVKNHLVSIAEFIILKLRNKVEKREFEPDEPKLPF